MKTSSIKARLIFLITLLSGFACLTSCKKQSQPVQNPPGDTTHTGGNTGSIYVSGYESGLTGNNIAEYWKDGVVQQLTDGKNQAQATGIAVSGNNVYVSGFEQANGISMAKYWKNGTSMTLSDGTLETQATGITVSGNDVYVCGYEINAAKYYIAKYWKNGVAVTIPYEGISSGSIPFSIAVSGSDVYMAGYVFNNLSNIGIAKYWKNTDVDVNLTGLLKNPSASGRAILLDSGNIYVAGEEQNADHTGVGIAEYWVNDVFHQLSDNIYDAKAYAIAKKGNDIYVAGSYEAKTGEFYANYWKNGKSFNFSDGQNAAMAVGIALSGDDVYGVGSETTDASRGFSAPRCWKNNTIITLASGTGGTSGRATGIAMGK